MKPSVFNLLTEFEATGESLVFNTGTGALISLPPELAGVATAVLAGSAPVGSLDDDSLGVLADQGFIVDDGRDEVAEVVERNRLGIIDGNRLDVFILPNMNCNFACPYCYEDHAPSQMSPEVEDRIVRWFEAVAPRFKVVLVSWFGGEPMLSFDQMVRVQATIKNICDEAGTTFNSHITTNGYLLNPKRAERLVEAGLLSYQITMDGPPEVHNAMRVLKGPGDSFERVFDNIVALARLEAQTNIKLRVNFNPETLKRVPELLEMIPPDVRPQLHLVLERLFGTGTLFINSTQQQVARATEETYELARQMGFAVTITPLEPTKLTYCYADRENQFLFNHVGDVFKCTVATFTPEERLGYLTDEGTVRWEGTSYEEWMGIPAMDDKCKACTYLPMCLGGCRKTRKLTGRSGPDCTLPFDALDVRVKQRYAAELAGVAVAPLAH